MPEFTQEHLLAARLRACGHFLYYQTGGKAGQRRILVTLLKRGELTQKELQDALEISSGALSEILQKIEEAGWIERRKSRSDKRQVKLALTDAGTSLALSVKEHYMKTLTRMFECLNMEERDQLEALLEKLVEHLDSIKNDAMFQAVADDVREGVPR